MDYRILGPLEVRDGDRAVALGGAKQRALLALLLLRANEAVATDQLLEALWPASPREEGVKALQVAVSRLRRALGSAATLTTRRPGYALRVGDGELDAVRFERLAEEGRAALAGGDAATASRLLRRALALWHGDALSDLTYHDACQAEIARLDELRLSAREDAIQADLDLGRHAQAVGDLERLVAEQPLRERPRGLHMLALYRSGRQAEALEAYRAARSVLVEELGVEPGRELQELHRRILEQDPALDAAGGAVAAPGDGGMVGRETELAVFDATLRAAGAGRGGLVLVAGEPGIGKSRLLDGFRTRAARAGAHVLAGRCWEAGGAPAYWPWIDALRPLVAGCDRELLERDPQGSAALATILPEIAERVTGLPAPPEMPPDAARFRLFDAAARLLRRAAREAPVVVTLDDLHAADVPSVLLLTFAARDLSDAAVVLVGAYREAELAEDPELAPLAADRAATKIALRGLATPDVATLVEAIAGTRPSDAEAAELHAETEGNPLFVTELARLGGGAIPDSVRDVIRRRLRGLPEDDDMVVTAALLGRELDVGALAAVAGVAVDEALDRLAPAVASGLLAPVSGNPSRLRFSHMLVRDALEDELAPGDRARRHRALAEGLVEFYGTRLDAHLAEVAHHFASAGNDPRTAEYARRGAERAERLLAFEEAARLYELAFRAVDADASGDAATQATLLLAIGEAWARAGRSAEAKAAFVEAAEVGRAAGLSEVVVRAALGFGYSGRAFWERAATDRRLVPLLEDALDALGEEDDPLRVQVLARIGTAIRGEDVERRERVVQEAVAMARRLGGADVIANALTARCIARWRPSTMRACLNDALEVLDLARTSIDLEREFAAHDHVLEGSWTFGDMAAVRSHLEDMRRISATLGQPAQRWGVITWDVLLALYEGRFADAETDIEEAYALGIRALPWNAIAMYRLQRFSLRDIQDRLGEVEEDIERSVGEYPDYPIFAAARVYVAARQGRADEARDGLARLSGDGFAGLGQDEMRLGALHMLGWVAAAVGDAAAEVIYDEMLEADGQVAVSPPELCPDAVARVLGRLAAALRRWDDAERHYADAHDLNARIGARPWIALTAYDHAGALLARGRDEDRRRAAQLAARAAADYRRLGIGSRAAAAEALAVRANDGGAISR
jgi:DNA-binding SARP family transcriptional activator